jgi:drug/metabolite transporter (DMT)-like permease
LSRGRIPKKLHNQRVQSFRPPPPRRAVASRLTYGAAFAMLCGIWGSTWLAIKVGLEGAPAFLAASLRFVVASVTLLALSAVFRSKLPRNRAEWALVGFYGLVLFTVDYGLIYWAEDNGVASGLSAILFATYPFQTAIAAHALLREERLSIQKLAGIALGFGGIIVIFRGQLIGADGLFFPMLAIVLSATCAAVASVAVKRWGHDTDPVSFNGLAMGTGAIALAAISLAAGEPWGVPSWPEGLGAILYLGLAGSVVTFVAFLWLLKRIEATTLSYIAFVTPIVAVLLGWFAGGEVLDAVVLGGAGMTLAGIWLSTSKRAAAWARTAFGTAVVPDGPSPDDPPGGKGAD